MSALTFILKLQDLLTPGMRQAAGISNTAAAQIESQFAKIGAGGKRMGASVDELRSRLDAINKVRFSTTIEKEFNIATKAASRLEHQIEKLENKGKKSGGGGLGMGGLIGGNLITGAITGGLGMVKDFGMDTYRTAMKSSSLSTAINSTTGGKGSEAMLSTNAIADKYGLNYEASLEGVKTLTGGLKGMNMPLAEQMKIFEGVSTGVAAMKLGAEESKGAMLALGQMASKGTVSAEELRGQLGERIPGAFGIAAKAMNVTEAQLGKMMEKGEVAAKDFLPKFAAEMQKTFGADALAAANGPQAIQERFNNAIFKMKASLGDGLMPLITPVMESFTQLATTIMPYVQQGIQFVSDTLKEVWGAVSGIAGGSGEWGSYIDVVKNLIGSVWITMKSLLGNVWGIAKGIIEWVGKSELMKDIFWALGKLVDGLLWVVRQVGDALQAIWDTIFKPILDAINWIYSKAKGLFTGGKSTIEVVNGTAAPVTPGSLPNAAQYIGIPFLKNPVNEMPGASITNAITANASTGGGIIKGADLGGKGDDNAKSKSSSINSGGQRSIVITIHKAIEKLEQHIIGGGQQAADEFASAVREALNRELRSLNGAGS